MAVVGGIEIEMWAGIARLQKDMDDAKRTVGDAMGWIKGAVTAALGALSINAFATWIKGAIDAAEALKDLSTRTGASVEALSALQAVGKFTGTSVESIAGAMGVLARNMANADEESKGAAAALRALGIDFDKFRAMKPDQQMVEVAKAMDKFQDGSGKAAVAMALMGREGAKMLPFLKDLAAQGELVAKVTTEQAEMADRYNDALTASAIRVEDMKRSVALGLLPTLIDLHDITGQIGSLFATVLKPASEGVEQKFDGMAIVIRVVGTALETVALIATDVVHVLKSIGTELGGFAAQVAAVLRGDWSQVGEIHRQMQADAAQAQKELEATQKAIAGVTDKTLQARDANRNHSLSAAENATELSRLTGRYGATSKAVLDFRNQTEKADASQRKLIQATRDYIRALDDKLEVSTIELVQGEELTTFQKLHAELNKKLEDGTISLTLAEYNEVAAKIEQTAANIEARKAVKDYEEALASVAKHKTKALDDDYKNIDQLRQSVVTLREQNETIGLSARALAERAVKVDLDTAADLEWQAAMQGGNYALEEQARLLRDRAAEITKGVGLKEAQETAAEWKKTTDSIYNGLTDSLFRAFEAGKGFWRVLWDGIVNTVKTTVLQPIIKLGADSVLSGLASLLGIAGPGGGASGGGGGGIGSLVSGGSTLSSLWNNGSSYVAGLFGGGYSGIGAATVASTGAGSTVVTPAILEAMSGTAGYGVAGAGAFAAGEGTAAAAGGAAASEGVLASMGPYGWIAAAVVAVVAALGLDHSGTHHQGSVVSATSAGAFTDPSTDPGRVLDHLNTSVDTFLKGTSSQALGVLNTLATMFGQSADFRTRGLFAADNTDASIGAFSISRGDRMIAEIQRQQGSDVKLYAVNAQEALGQYSKDIGATVRDAMYSVDLPKWARDALAALGDSPTLDQLSAVVQQIQAVANALTSEFEPLGGVFGHIAQLSVDAKLQLAEFAGGIDAFIAKSRNYVDLYYTEQEKLALKARDILAGAAGVGLDASGASQVMQLRQAMDSIDASTEQGRKQIAFLLTVAGDYKQVGEYLEKNNLTLGELAKASPQVAALDALRSPSETTAEATTATASATAAVADQAPKQTEKLADIAEGTTAVVEATSTGLTEVAGLLREILAAVRPATVAVPPPTVGG